MKVPSMAQDTVRLGGTYGAWQISVLFISVIYYFSHRTAFSNAYSYAFSGKGSFLPNEGCTFGWKLFRWVLGGAPNLSKIKLHKFIQSSYSTYLPYLM